MFVILHLPALICNLHIAYNIQLHMSYMMHLQPWGVFPANFFSIPSPRKCVVPGNGQLCKCAATVMEPAGSTAFSMKLWDKWCKIFFESFLLERCHYVSLWTIQQLHPKKMPFSEGSFEPKIPEVSLFESASPFGTEAHHACFSCCAIAVTSDSPVVVAMLQAGKPNVNKPWKRGLTNPGL